MIYGWCIFLAYSIVEGLLFASTRKWGIDGFRKITLWEKIFTRVPEECNVIRHFHRTETYQMHKQRGEQTQA
jgi:hypothetical protein